jgi:hypothetical protein
MSFFLYQTGLVQKGDQEEKTLVLKFIRNENSFRLDLSVYILCTNLFESVDSK